jgi:hypothetical protein
MQTAFPGYSGTFSSKLHVPSDIPAKIAELPMAYSNPSPILPTVLDTPPPDGISSYLEGIIADAVAAQEGKIFTGMVAAVIVGTLLLKFL